MLKYSKRILKMSTNLARIIERLSAKYKILSIAMFHGHNGPYYRVFIERKAIVTPPPLPSFGRTCSRVDEEIQAGKEVGFRPTAPPGPRLPPGPGGLLRTTAAKKTVTFAEFPLPPPTSG